MIIHRSEKRKSVGSGSISHLNDISCGCKVDIGNVFSNGPYQTRLVRPTFTLCSPDIIYVTNASELPQFFTTLLLSFIIGASLSEPHTSVTALCTCVCMLACLLACLRPYTVNFK